MVEYKKLGNIFCKYFHPKGKLKKIIIAVHGFAGDKESSAIMAVAEALRKHTLVVAFDLPCHGEEKDGVLKLGDCYEYLDSVLKDTRGKYPNIPISLFATSFGAFLSLNYLKSKPYNFDRIILRSPAIFMDETLVNNILPLHHILFETLQEHKVNLSHEKGVYVNMEFLSDLKTNTLSNIHFNEHLYIIQGDADDIVDFKKNEEFYKANCSGYSLYYIKGADHRFKKAGELDVVVDIVKRIMDKK